MKFKAAVITKKKKIEILDLETQPLNDKQVLIKNYYSSLCKTQVDEWKGVRGNSKMFPNCFGHEAISKIVKVGKKVKSLKKDDLVCVSWIQKNTEKAMGTKYIYKNKFINAGPVNTFSTYSVVFYNRLYKISKKEFKKKTTLMGCAAFTSFNVILNNLTLRKNMKISIIGIGGLGLSCLLILRQLGFKNLYAYDIENKKIKIARNEGFLNSFSSKKSNVIKKMKENDIIIDCSGNIDAINTFFPKLKENGGQYILVSNTNINSSFRLKTWDVIKGRRISGAWIKPLNESNNFKIYKKIFFKINAFNNFFQKTYKLENLQTAFKDFESGKNFRPIIKIN